MAVVTITTDFTGKKTGSLIENSNIARSTEYLVLYRLHLYHMKHGPTNLPRYNMIISLTGKETQFYNFDGNTAYAIIFIRCN